MRRPIRTTVALVAVGAALVVAGCASVASRPANPLIPADTARDTVDKANDAANGLQNQIDQSTTP